MPKKSEIKLKILEILDRSDCCAWDIVTQLGISPQLAAHHLKRLESEGSVTSRVVAPQRIVFIDSAGQQAYSKTRTKRIYQLKSLEIEDKEA
jgi:predicted transcriptional regulator